MSFSSRSLSRVVLAVVAVLLLQGLPVMSSAAVAKPSCVRRILVLSAYPGEIGKNLKATQVRETVMLDNHQYFVGRLQGVDVVLALTGIGLVNAEKSTKAAFAHFRCGSTSAISGVVFSGVAGGPFIGDVVVPQRWTIDNGKTWMPVDASMFAVAKQVKQRGSAKLGQDAMAGDPACVGTDPNLVREVHVDHVPQLRIGGRGKSADPFGGRQFTCVPCGGDVFGCEPCAVQKQLLASGMRFASTAPAFVDPNFILGYFAAPVPATTTYDSEDMETAAVFRVAARNHVPYIAFRAVSDGQGDPLNLPGFPYQFFVYKQLAADNAAAVTQAFLAAWGPRHR
jgi:nucleoside phosphorylase